MLDLYREDFNPVLSWEELRRKWSFDRKVQRYGRQLRKADRLCVVHPDWWGAPPALLKGWIERVLRPEVAYRYVGEDFTTKEPQGLLSATRLLVAVTSDGEEGSGSSRAIRALWEHIARFCGFAEHTIMIMHAMQQSSLHQRRAFLQKIAQQM